MPRSTRNWILPRPSSPGTIRTSTSSGSNCHSFRSRDRSLDMPALYARKRRLRTSAGNAGAIEKRILDSWTWHAVATETDSKPMTVPTRQDAASTSLARRSRLTGSMTLVFRSTANTIVRCSAPSRLLATIGRTWRRSGRLKRTANVPSLRIFTGSPRSVTWASGWVTP